MLHGQLVKLKKLETIPAQRNRADVKVSRREFAEWLNDVRNDVDHELIYVDESGFNLHMCRTRGRAVVGNRAVRVVNGQKGPNISCVMAVSATRGVIPHEFRLGGVTGDVFNAFLAEAVKQIGNGMATFILDNAPCHRRARPVALADNHMIRFLPAYSPFLNIVENAWSTWKAVFKQELAERRPQLLQQTHAERMRAMMEMGD